MITVTFDPARRLVRATMVGWLTITEVETFSSTEQAAVRSMGLSTGQFDLLVETQGNVVQSQEVTDLFADLMRRSPLKARKIAIVRDGVLTRMQSRRINKTRSNAEVFDTIADAEAWISL